VIKLSLPTVAQLQAAFKQAPQVTISAMLAAMTEATLLLEREAKELMPTASGMTRASISSDAFITPVGVIGITASNQPSAAFVELGTRPHMPPIAPIQRWVQDRLGITGAEGKRVAWLVARKIARQGTKPQKIFERTLQANEGQLVAIFEGAVQRLAGHLQGGAA
jgi:hypothetical protein